MKWQLSQQKCMFVLSGHFKLNPESGELRTAVNLDYEEVSQYVILIQANEKVSSAAEVQRSGNFWPFRGAMDTCFVFAIHTGVVALFNL